MKLKSAPSVVFRTDSSMEIGSGHVMRCIALAQQLRSRGFAPIFLASEMASGLARRLESEKISLEIRNDVPIGSLRDSESTRDRLNSLNANWLVIDGYQLGTEFQAAIASDGTKTLLIDDCGYAEKYSADLILNQNIYATEDLYRKKAPKTKLLLGNKYALLRTEFTSVSSKLRVIRPQLENVLITLGGADIFNSSKTILEALELTNLKKLNISMVVGSLNPNVGDLELTARKSKHNISIHTNTSEMPKFIQEADVAISGGGSTCLELCYLGLPFATMVLSENQEHAVRALETAGASVDLGWHDQTDKNKIRDTLELKLFPFEARTRLASRASALVDGQGSHRVAEAMLEAR